MTTDLVSLMNNTKWREALDVAARLHLRCRIKWTDVVEPTEWQRVWLETDRHIEGTTFTPACLSDIEWLDIEPVSRICDGLLLPERVLDRTGEVTELLTAAQIPHVAVGPMVRIAGYQRLASGV